MIRRSAVLFALLLPIGCGERATSDATATAPATPAASPALDPPREDVPPATAPADASLPPAAPSGLPTPAAGAITFAGFGPAKFGDGEEALRMSWGKELERGPGDPGACTYLFPQPRPAKGYRLAFMVEGDRFVRLDVDAADIAAPGGGRVGMDAAAVEALYRGRIETLPHKYVEGGRYLRVSAADGAPGVLVFEADADGRVEEWRVGIAPQVDYVEGCS